MTIPNSLPSTWWREITLPRTTALSPVGKKSCRFTTLPTSRWCPMKIHRNVIPRTVHQTLLPMANIPLMILGLVTTLTPIRNLIPEVQILTPNPMVDWVQTLRVAMIVAGVTLVTCSAQGRPTSPPPRNRSHGHNPAAAAGPTKQIRKSGPIHPPQRTIHTQINRSRRKRNRHPGKAGCPRVLPKWLPRW